MKFFTDKLKNIGHKINVPLTVYVLLLIGVTVFVSNKGGAYSYVLFFSAWLYIPVSLIQIFYTRFVFRIYQDVPERLLYKSISVPYQITLGNAGPFPISGIRLTRDEELTDFEEDFTPQDYKLLPKEHRVIETRMSCRYAGGHTEGITRITISDMFGIFHISYDIPLPLRVHVLPVVTDVAAKDINRLFEEKLNRSSVFQLEKEDLILGDEMRKYRAGDKLNTVHWKNYARTGELLVRLPDKRESDMMTLVIMPAEKSDIKKRDYMLEYIVSVADWFAKHGKPVRVMYHCAGVKNFIVDSYSSFNVFYHEKLLDFGDVGRELPEGAVALLTEAVAKQSGAVVVFHEDSGDLK